MTAMFPVPTSLSPSRVESFLSCPLAFRFASIERLPEPPTIHTTRGSLAHRALELLFLRPPGERGVLAAHDAVLAAFDEYATLPDLVELGLAADEHEALLADVHDLVARYLVMEDPNAVREIGLELRLEAPVGELTLRGIIDRLDLDEQGELVVVDYKTGRAPSRNFEQQRMSGVHFYSFLCEAVLGRRPAAIRLMYLRTGEIIEARPSEQSVRYVSTRASAVLGAVRKACETGTFLPRPGALCGSCAFRQWCPAFGGDPELAAVELRRDDAVAAA
jgi:putative RecB family exonuclease